ncbi:hypothetical protein [Carboxydothermus ferrireducens]|uniref:Bla regulator protein blaR1 n=1 Tax=Carboxydothermus ferrireducens DSM 11255 TaxID=1119529 RepID=A0ABX2R966_9THEO|nr:hypothetical protein [Carboxydothermus ferrireducens]NYE57721.1 hypothetical protein [Carboxydothermus ferrireducens DSM 11255]
MKKILSAFLLAVLAVSFISTGSYPEYELCQKIMGKPEVKNPELKIIFGSKINKRPEDDLKKLAYLLNDNFTFADLGTECFAEGRKYWVLYQPEENRYERLIAGPDLFLPEERGLRYYLLEFTYTGRSPEKIVGGTVRKIEKNGENTVVLGYTPALNTGIMIKGEKVNYQLIITSKPGGAGVKLGIPVWLGNY